MLTSPIQIAEATSPPSKLKIFIGPDDVPADNRTYNVIAVQLQDSKNLPARAEEDTLITLSSSVLNVGSVESSITVPKGSTYGKALFHSTFTPGSTTITASASSYATVQAKLNTIGPIPSTLAVYAFPPVLPADNGTYPAVIVQLQDSSGNPARAPNEGLQINITSSNTEVGDLTDEDRIVTIEGGQTYAVANFRAVAGGEGQSSVIAQAPGYGSKQTTIKTQNMTTGTGELTVKVYVSPPKVMADKVRYSQLVAVQVQDSRGKIYNAPAEATVILSSSNLNVGTVTSSIKIAAQKNYNFADFDSTYTSGTTTLIAAAQGYASSQQSLTTVGPIPSKLAVFSVPSTLAADGQSTDSIRVQLQDSSGKPAKDPVGDITVYLFSSEPDCGNVSQTLTIPFGQTYALGNFVAACSTNSTTITAQSSGYESGQAKINTYLIDNYTLNMAVTAEPSALYTGNQSKITVYVTYNGTVPAPGVKVTLGSNKGGNFSSVTDSADGYYTIFYTAPAAQNNTICTITVNATKTSYNGSSTKLMLTINPSSSLAGNIQLQVTEPNGNPISDAAVTATAQSSSGASFSGTTNGTGYLALSNILEGTYVIEASKSGYETKTQTITVVSGQTTYPLIELSATGFPIIFVIIPVIVVIVVGAVVYLRRFRNREEDEEESL